jgi:OHCU decarboxylase
MEQHRKRLTDLNTADQEAFIAAIGFVFERSPWIAAQAWSSHPFASLDALHRAMCDVVLGAPRVAQLDLIRAHPDLAGKAAIAGALTAESRQEQSSVGLDRLSAEEFAIFTTLNTAYREWFGFPFIICVREHTKESILAAFRIRLLHTPEEEIATALAEIAKIARLRLADTVIED